AGMAADRRTFSYRGTTGCHPRTAQAVPHHLRSHPMAARSRVLVLTTLYRAARIAMRPGGPSLPTRLASIPRLVRSTLTGRYAGVTTGRLALMAAAVAYIVSPLDLIPEGALLLLGTLDDAMVLSWLAAATV